MTATPIPITEGHREPLPQRRPSEMFELRHGGKQAVFHVTVGYYDNACTRLGEVFVAGSKSGTEVEANVRDAAILVSLALQYGVPVDVMRHATTREADGTPSTIIGMVLDRLGAEVRS